MDTFDIVTVGDATIDAFLTLKDEGGKVYLDTKSNYLCVKFGEKIDVVSCDFSLGGNATNVAVGVSRLGLKTALAVEIGDDEFSAKIINTLTKEKIDQRLIKRTLGGASSLSIALNLKGDRTLFVEHVARKHDFNLDDINCSFIYLTSLGNDWVNPYKKILSIIQNKNIKLVFNPGTLQLSEGRDMILQILKYTQILFVNKQEAEKIVFDKEQQNPDLSLSYITSLFDNLKGLGVKIVIITDGENGSYVSGLNGEVEHSNIVHTQVVERTGAGDGYTAGFMAAYILGLDFKTAMRWGSVNSASVVGKIGAQPGLLTREEINVKITIDEQ